MDFALAAAISARNSGARIVTAAPLTVTADPQSKMFAELDPALTYRLTGGTLFNGVPFLRLAGARAGGCGGRLCHSARLARRFAELRAELCRGDFHDQCFQRLGRAEHWSDRGDQPGRTDGESDVAVSRRPSEIFFR